MYLITKTDPPKLALAAQVEVEVEEHFLGEKVSAYLGPLAEWVCIVNHDEPGSTPPAGYGLSASVGGVPHIHAPTGLTLLQEDLWVVVYDDQPHVLTIEDIERDFYKPAQIYSPTLEMRREWAALRFEREVLADDCPACKGRGYIVSGDKNNIRKMRKTMCEACQGTKKALDIQPVPALPERKHSFTDETGGKCVCGDIQCAGYRDAGG